MLHLQSYSLSWAPPGWANEASITVAGRYVSKRERAVLPSSSTPLPVAYPGTPFSRFHPSLSFHLFFLLVEKDASSSNWIAFYYSK